MAKFEPAFERTLRFEGSYVDDPDDRGGETYCGVSRRFHPHWPGWRIIDGLRKHADFPDVLGADVRLGRAVAELYREQYWDLVGASPIADQAVAASLFDAAVHLGPQRAVRLLQEALNLLRRDTAADPYLVLDGLNGAMTQAALARQLARDRSNQSLLELFGWLRGELLLARVRQDPAQRRFLRGWLRRIRNASQRHANVNQRTQREGRT